MRLETMPASVIEAVEEHVERARRSAVLRYRTPLPHIAVAALRAHRVDLARAQQGFYRDADERLIRIVLSHGGIPVECCRRPRAACQAVERRRDSQLNCKRRSRRPGCRFC